MSIQSWFGKLKIRPISRWRAAILFVLILLAGGIGTWLYVGNDADQYVEEEPDPKAGPLAGEMRYILDSVTEFTVYQYEIARSCPAYAEMLNCRQKSPPDPKNLLPGAKDLDIVRAVVVSGPSPLTILTSKRSESAKTLFDDETLRRMRRSKENGHTLYLDGKFGYWIEGRQIVLGEADQLRLLHKSRGKRLLDDRMLQAIERADWGKPEIHFDTIKAPRPGARYTGGRVTLQNLEAVDAALRELRFEFFLALFFSERGDVTLVSDLDYETPMTLRLSTFCGDAKVAQHVANYFRDPKKVEHLRPLKYTVERDDETVILKATVHPCDPK